MGLFDLGRNELNSAEATSFFIAGLDWGDTWTSLSTSELNGGPFYLLLHFWRGLGDTEFILRILPLLFGVATPVVLYRLVTRLFGPAYGLGAAGLLAINAFFVAHMQNLRSYSMSAFLATVATLLFVKVIEDKSRSAVIGYALTGALLVYTHFFGAMVLLVHALSLLLLEKKKIPRKELLRAFVAMAVLVVPVGVFVLASDVGQIDWIPELSGDRVRLGLGELVGLGGNVQLALYGVLSAMAVVMAVRFRREGRGSRLSWATGLVVMWLLLPLLGAILISLAKPLFEARYLLITLPPLATCAVLALGSIRRQMFVTAVFVLTAALTASQLPGWYADFNEPEWGNRADVVLREGTPDDGIIFYAPP
ncbi:MAG TPA: glycosyltransferase family 39 protein, partial [Actinomycetota bacterium]|nr:glycosyltransferase family 39 protein [Actinomycetota bacterium]